MRQSVFLFSDCQIRIIDQRWLVFLKWKIKLFEVTFEMLILLGKPVHNSVER